MSKDKYIFIIFIAYFELDKQNETFVKNINWYCLVCYIKKSHESDA